MLFCCCENPHNHRIKSNLSKVITTNQPTTIQYGISIHYFDYINTGITMENTALNGTTSATKNQEWKTKKGYGPSLVVAVSLALLLGLSFYAGRQVGGGGTNFRRGELGMTNAVASSSSSSSTSLVGSGTAASDLKTLTIVVDDNELIDGLLSVKPKGGSSAYCKKNTGYNCGAVFPPNGDTCGQKGCCCRDEDGTG